MSEQTTAVEGQYGYQNDERPQNPFDFGLNAGVTYLKELKWIHNGGKDGTEQEALNIVFNINGTDKSYRRFPFTRAYKGDVEITDPNAKEFKDGLADYNAVITHILKAFVSEVAIQTALSKRIASFKDFCTITEGLLPKDFDKKPLDIFLQYQWQIPEGKDRTYLDIPGNMKHGKWLCPARAGEWKETRVDNPKDTVREALFYTNEKGEKHDFVRKGWFVNNNFAKQQKIEGDTDTTEDTTASDAAGAAAQNASTGGGTTATW